ncbi:hypothetical protein D9758_001056 [Tetrapyrgos nigripes]|uniref:Uncharacterized protein n=1 Tax=Tetrapyrgos nigripes TaxID=182062 RepID=A0A8H5GS39_9AGAR|nr:hypothetical protein D9758_001056 [Tetrapyrgos nigripes]
MFPLVLLFLCSLSLVASIPTWMYAPGQSQIGSLVPGAAYIEALGVGYQPERASAMQRHLASEEQGHLGNVTVIFSRRKRSADLFYINRQQLWQFANETAIFPVNLVNTTTVIPDTGEVPLRLVTGNKDKNLISSGTWRWRGTMLLYDLGPLTNGGVYYDCPQPTGGSTVITFLKPVPTPDGCNLVTLHAWSQLSD